MNNPEIKEIQELLKNLNPEMTEVELEKKARNIFELAVFLVQLQIRTLSKATETSKEEDLPIPTARSP